MLQIICSIFEKEDIIKVKEAGASSILVGTPFFSVRSVSHFDMEELKTIVSICKKEHIHCYVLVNRFFVESELGKLQDHLMKLKALDVDGIYFSDMGVFEEAVTLGLASKMIYNPDTILTNHLDVQAYLDLGMKMCTLAKEITLEDMIKIAKQVDGDMEVIIHGRLNMMHSKRNLLTNYMTFLQNDASLRDRYDLTLREETREECMPIVEDEHGTHIYTGFTLCSFEEVEDILRAGIKHVRIESMFFTMDELCQIIKDYRYVEEHPQEGRAMYKKYETTYPQQHIAKGFLYKKTGLVK